MFEKLIDSFMPAQMRCNKTHPQYEEFRVILSSAFISLPVLALFPFGLHLLGQPFAEYYINFGLIVCMVLSIRTLGHYRIPMTLLAIVTYFIIYGFIKDTGLIYSPQMGVLHIYLLAAIWVDKRWGWLSIITNLCIFFGIYRMTIVSGVDNRVADTLGSPLYSLLLHCFITVLLGVFLAYEQFDQERNRKRIRALLDQRITELDKAVHERTEQLDNMRQVMAADFHDETGNMLSAITMQAALLRRKLEGNEVMQATVDSIIRNSNELYSRSKDFLWNLNQDSNDPLELFSYLTSQGQLYFNQFDIAFSAVSPAQWKINAKIDPFASLNMVFMYKEAMTNIVKHANANEVVIGLMDTGTTMIFSIQDNGHWKEANADQPHYGLSNMERRCEKNKIGLQVLKNPDGTRLEFRVPVLSS